MSHIVTSCDRGAAEFRKIELLSIMVQITVASIIIVIICAFCGIVDTTLHSSKAGDDETQFRVQRAAYYHTKGMQLINSGEQRNGLAHLRTACRLYNQSELYWNDLGVTEMRMGHLRKARQRFIRALALNENFRVAKANLNDLDAYLKQSSPSLLRARTAYDAEHIIHSTVEMKRKEYTSLSDLERDRLMLYPFIIRGYVSKYKMKALLSSKNLIERYGQQVVDYYPHNMLEEQVHPFFQTLRQSIDHLSTPDQAFLDVDASEPGTYVQWNLDESSFHDLLSWSSITIPQALDDSIPLECFHNSEMRSEFLKKTHWKMVLIGEEGAGMFLHQDILLTGAYQIQLRGRKQWHLCDESQTPYLYKAGDVDLFAPDYDSFPMARHANCSELTIYPGDLLFYPHSYWHQTRNLDTPTIALSSSVITAESVSLLVEELAKECAGSRRIFTPSASLCTSIEHCSEHWMRLYFNDHHTHAHQPRDDDEF